MAVAAGGRRALLVGAVGVAVAGAALAAARAQGPPLPPASTPVQHVVVLFGENESFDHYFGTYPNAANPPGQPRFDARPDTPPVNGLSPVLLTSNPNSANPRRLDRSEAVTCDQKHGYGDEQKAADMGLMDRFVEFTGGGSCTDPGIVMGYYDGNTVTALWNLAQRFALNDNSFGTTFGPSTPGAINLVSGNTHGITPTSSGTSIENGTMIGDPQPVLDDCSTTGIATMTGRNVGDLMNAHNVTWGWFQGGFRPTSRGTDGKAACGATHYNAAGAPIVDYIPHHEPFQYYASTANPHHLPPSSVDKIGFADQANHQYDLADFDAALAAGNLPQVSFLKAAAFEDAHPGYSGPLDEQHFVTRVLNALQQSPQWSSTLVFLAYDDSDGWYDHVMSPIVNPSAAPSDALNGPGKCGNVRDPNAYPDRCGYGPRLPLMVVSPFAKQDFVDSAMTDQTSVLRFIEDNWQLGRIGDQSADAHAGPVGNMLDLDPEGARAPKVFLDPISGKVVSGPGAIPGGTAPIAVPPTPTATVAATATTVVSGTVPPPEPAPAPAARRVKAASVPAVKLSCQARGGARRVTITCTARGSDAARTPTAVRFRIVRKGSVLATARTTLSHQRARVVLRPKHRLKAGRYTLRITVTQTTGVLALTRTIRLK
jgi:phospholipase C